MCEAIYIGNNHQTFKKILDGHLSDLLCLLKNVQKLDSFAAHFEQNFNSDMSRTDLRKCMTSKVVNPIIPIDKKITKSNYNLYIEEHLIILIIHM